MWSRQIRPAYNANLYGQKGILNGPEVRNGTSGNSVAEHLQCVLSGRKPARVSQKPFYPCKKWATIFRLSSPSSEQAKIKIHTHIIGRLRQGPWILFCHFLGYLHLKRRTKLLAMKMYFSNWLCRFGGLESSELQSEKFPPLESRDLRTFPKAFEVQSLNSNRSR